MSVPELAVEAKPQACPRLQWCLVVCSPTSIVSSAVKSKIDGPASKKKFECPELVEISPSASGSDASAKAHMQVQFGACSPAKAQFRPLLLRQGWCATSLATVMGIA